MQEEETFHLADSTPSGEYSYLGSIYIKMIMIEFVEFIKLELKRNFNTIIYFTIKQKN